MLLGLGVVFFGGLGGCGSTQKEKEPPPKECKYLLPQWGENIRDEVEYTGRTAAMDSVDIKARVTGFLKEVLFKEGAEVDKDQELFLIDPEPYNAQFEQADAQVGLYKAQEDLTKTNFALKDDLRKKNPNAVTDLDWRQTRAAMIEALAARKAAEATLKIYRINQGFTTVRSPIKGVVGRRNQAPGNVILQDQTLLTTVVSVDPIYVYFDMDAPTFARFHVSEPGKNGPAPGALGPIDLELPGQPTGESANEASYLPGTIDFVNNQFNPGTDTLLVRGRFRNPAKLPLPALGSSTVGLGTSPLGAGPFSATALMIEATAQTAGAPRLRPGMFARVKLRIGQPYGALLVPDYAIISKMGKKYVYVAGADNRVKAIPVVIGQLQEKRLRVIRPGELTAKDRVIVTRLLEIQPNDVVQPSLLVRDEPAPPRKDDKVTR
jgi:multidrug efflux system membrane fusion protein